MAVHFLQHFVHFFGRESDQRNRLAADPQDRRVGESSAGECDRRRRLAPAEEIEKARIVEQTAHYGVIEETAVGGQEENFCFFAGQVEALGSSREKRIGAHRDIDPEHIQRFPPPCTALGTCCREALLLVKSSGQDFHFIAPGTVVEPGQAQQANPAAQRAERPAAPHMGIFEEAAPGLPVEQRG